jgi:hypothetical protein
MAEPTLFDAAEKLRNVASCEKSQTVDASHLGPIRTVVLTNLGAELICEHGTLMLSVEQWFHFVKYRKPA